MRLVAGIFFFLRKDTLLDSLLGIKSQNGFKSTIVNTCDKDERIK